MTDKPFAGKYLLEILTKGMYSNALHVYREYVQNSVDSIDKAVADKILAKSNAEIHICVDEKKREIVVRDNGGGIRKDLARKILMSVGASDKDGVRERGFRGIGRLAGLAYAEEVRFTTSAVGENVKTVMICDCVKLKRLLQKSSNETTELMETFEAIARFEFLPENADEHYFEVRMTGVPEKSELLDVEKVKGYLVETAPVDFDAQRFRRAEEIRSRFEERGVPITCYKILFNERNLPIYKKYGDKWTTGKQQRTSADDEIYRVEFVEKKAADGSWLYVGWLAITNFSGMISDDSIQGIRLRKGNILVGDGKTFADYFPSEGPNANRYFAGEIYALHQDLIPNSQRDDFERTDAYDEMFRALSEWAEMLNKKYRRGTSEATSALRKLDVVVEEQRKLEVKVEEGAITSDVKREQLNKELEQIEKSREKERKNVRKAIDRGDFGEKRKKEAEQTLRRAEAAAKEAPKLQTKIAAVDYATKHDLPSSYNRDERKLYQRIIEIIDAFFQDDAETAEKLRAAIKKELSVKKS